MSSLRIATFHSYKPDVKWPHEQCSITVDWEKDIGGGTPGYVVSEVTHWVVRTDLSAQVSVKVPLDDRSETIFVANGQTREDEDNAIDAGLRHYWKRRKEYCERHNLPF